MAASLQVAPWFQPARRTIVALALVGTVAAGAFALLRPTPHQARSERTSHCQKGRHHGWHRSPPPPRHHDDDEDCAAALAAHAAARRASPDHVAPGGPRDQALGACAARHPHRY
ncbi:MAG: hypothetical protein IPH44_02465 [Myxococcales bacterium]|nr:hypothetical protein [Myxococcales bacterium]MBK7198181.1 hypothetical protein [Myxococcales bacterium]MBP6844583.1 hypothetical protein [Kofleriaceae bacterium]